LETIGFRRYPMRANQRRLGFGHPAVPFILFSILLLGPLGTSPIKGEEKGKPAVTKPSTPDSLKKASAPKDTVAQNLRDPFLPWGEVPGKGPPPPPLQLKLKGILWGPRKPLAIVSDAQGISYIVSENQDIGDGRVIQAIKKDRILIREKSGKVIELKCLETQENRLFKP
jgi:type II secretory pathway component PulC